MSPSPATVLVEERFFIFILLGAYVVKSVLFGLIQTEAPVSTITLLSTLEFEKHSGYSVEEMSACLKSTFTRPCLLLGTIFTTFMSLERYLTM
jgi:hypothetical protein